ncbi:MAG: polyribonucleotide nucleotidyltransferase [Lentisphaeria bacterium]
MATHSVDIDLGGGKTATIETGKMALLAGGSVTVRMGDTIVLVAACCGAPRPGIDFFPLQVDYREKFSAAGRFPGGFFKREGRPSEKEILTCRMTDRPLRPLFPKGFKEDTQIQALLLSTDGENEADVLAMLGASAALVVSDIPFLGPIGTLRVGRVDGNFIANPTHEEMAESDLDLVYAGVEDKVIMIEGASDEVSEEVLRDSLTFANEVVKKQIAAQRQLAEVAGKEKVMPDIQLVPQEIADAVSEFCDGKLREPCLIPEKEKRYKALDDLRDEMFESFGERFADENESRHAKTAFVDLTAETIRRLLLDENIRSDGRGPDDLRQIDCEVGVLPRTHGTGLFARGETQALVVTTLGTGRDTQDSDGITGGETSKSFMLHYNFPNFSVGETGRIMGPGRREIGHGALAERSVARMMPKDYPYTVRCLSEVMASNGSTSMASICGATLSMLDAGIPMIRPVAGISCGLVIDGDRTVLLTDILGSEDHYGDMDFKVAGTTEGITGFQLDLKIPGISIDLMYEAMLKNKTSRFKILESMAACIAEPRPELSPYAPQIEQLKINPEKIGAIIGPGGKTIRQITEDNNVQIDVEQDGAVNIYATNGEDMASAVHAINSLTAEVEIGAIYRGEVKTVREFGAFVEVISGQDGLLHISEMADYRVEKVEDICKEGDKVTVKVIDIDDRGRIRLSRRAALEEIHEESATEA